MNIEFSFHLVDLFSVENAAMKGWRTRSLYVSSSLKAALVSAAHSFRDDDDRLATCELQHLKKTRAFKDP